MNVYGWVFHLKLEKKQRPRYHKVDYIHYMQETTLHKNNIKTICLMYSDPIIPIILLLYIHSIYLFSTGKKYIFYDIFKTN